MERWAGGRYVRIKSWRLERDYPQNWNWKLRRISIHVLPRGVRCVRGDGYAMRYCDVEGSACNCGN
ncbi:MAG TPA: hypothetical protein VFI95_07780 [Terriglobales bacterium]|nr:hypothetical protein [Terriglobales bacterium]